MPKNGHDSSSREIFSSPHGSFSGLPDTPGVLDHAAAAPDAGSFRIPQPGASPGVVGQRFTPASDGAVQRPLRGVGQDKAALAGGSTASPEPGPVTQVVRAGVADTVVARSPNHPSAREKKVKGGVWMWSRVKEAIQTIADHSGLSFSATAAEGLEVFARAKIHEQEEELFEPRMRAMLRQEIRASDNRHIYFEMRNAIAAEQTRILTTDLYKRQLTQEGLSQEQIEKKVDQAYSLARANVLKKTPQLKSLLDAWWADSQEKGGKEGEGA